MPTTVILNTENGTLNGDATGAGDDLDLLDGSAEQPGGDPSIGSAFYNQQISLNEDFTFTLNATLTGADGFAVVLHNDADGANALGGVGRQIGTGGIDDGIGIEFDTFLNNAATGGDETSDNHSHIVDTDGNIFQSSSDISAPNNALPVDLNDGNEHSYVISWDASSRTMTWSIDGTQVGSRTFTEAELDSFLTDDRSVFIGLTSGNFLDGDTQISDATLTATFVCIQGDAMIATDQGQLAIKDLSVGDRVLTDSGEYEAIRWIGSRVVKLEELLANPKLLPVRIKAGALGRALPAKDLLVSRQHRMKVSSKIAQRVTESQDVLIPAFRLTELPGIEVAEDVKEVSYFHILCDRHEVIFAESAPTETMLPGAQAMLSLSADQREEILTIFPELSLEIGHWQPAFPIPSAQHQKRIVERHGRNEKPILTF
jgi:hypothetical protein